MPSPTTIVWTAPTGVFDRLVAVTSQVLVVANPPPTELETLEARLVAGEHPVALMGKDAKVIPLDALTKVSANRHGTQANFSVGTGRSAAIHNIDFTSAAARDEFFQALGDRLGPGFKAVEKVHSPISAAVKPGISLAIVGAITWGAYLVAQRQATSGPMAAQGRRTQFLLDVVGWLGPTGILIAGGAIRAMLLIWLAMRVAKPPHIVTLSA